MFFRLTMVVCGLCLGHTNRLVVHVQFLFSIVFYEINALFLYFFCTKNCYRNGDVPNGYFVGNPSTNFGLIGRNNALISLKQAVHQTQKIILSRLIVSCSFKDLLQSAHNNAFCSISSPVLFA